MEQVKYSQTYYPGYVALDLNIPFAVSNSQNQMSVITVLNHHVGIQLLDVNTRINVLRGNDLFSYNYDIATKNSGKGALLSKEVLDQIHFNPEWAVPNHSIDDLAIVYEWSPKPRFIQNVYVTEILIARMFSPDENKNEYNKEEELLELFLSKYREVAQDIHVRLPSENQSLLNRVMMSKVIDLTKEEMTLDNFGKLTISRTLTDLNTNALSCDSRDIRKASKPLLATSEVSAKLISVLAKTPNVDPGRKVLNKAMEEIIIYKNYNYALLELFIYSESLTTKFLTKKKVEKGISLKKIEDIDVPFSYLLNIELPLFLPIFTAEWKNIIGEINWVRSKRNKFVHEGTPVTEEEARKAHKSVERFLDAIKFLL